MKITSLEATPVQSVSHNPAIKKHVLIKNGEINRITQFSRAVFSAGQIAPLHCHADMAEIFYIESGCAQMEVNGSTVSLPAGSCITVEPGEYHELRNTEAHDMTVLYFGVIVDG